MHWKCTFNPLRGSSYFTCHRVNDSKTTFCPKWTTVCFVLIKKKKRLLPYATLTGWFSSSRNEFTMRYELQVLSLNGRIMAQRVSRPPPSGTGSIPGHSMWHLLWTKLHREAFYCKLFNFPLSISFYQYSVSSSTCCSYRKGKRVKPGNLPQSNNFSEIGEHWIEKNLFVFKELT